SDEKKMSAIGLMWHSSSCFTSLCVQVCLESENETQRPKMTPDGIRTEDWNRVHDAACEIVNASSMDDPVLCDHHTSKLFEILHELECQYGRIPSILSTRADFSDDPHVAIPLLEEALQQSSDPVS